MENATKALMIAGAVLIAIMIIGVGVMIFQSGNETINSSIGRMDEIAKKQWNSGFESYEGDNIKGSKVKSLISTIITSNATIRDSEPEKLIHFIVSGVDKITVSPASGDNGDTDEAYLADVRTKLVAGETYNIKLGYKQGLVTSITLGPKTVNN